MQHSSPSDNPDTKEGKEHSSLLCQKCLSMAEFLRDWEGEIACTDVSRCLFKLSDKLHSSGWLRYCHLNLLWDFST